MTVGERIKSSRIAKGATQEELAKVLGTTKQTIYKYENNIVSNIGFLFRCIRILSYGMVRSYKPIAKLP